MVSGLLNDAKIFLTLFLITFLIGLVDNLGFLYFPKSFLQQVTIPIQYGLFKTSGLLSKQFEFIFTARRVVNESRALKEQYALILSENSQLRRELAETKGFLDQQRSLNSQNFSTVAARPIGFSRYLLIDKGSEDGVKKDQPVVYKDNYLGKIKEVSQKKSQVILSSDPDSRIASFSSSSVGKAKGVLNGQFGQEMLFDKILHDEPLSKGALIYTEGTEQGIPRGLVLGQISEVLEKENEVFKKAKVKNVFEAKDLEIVFVIIN